MGMRTYSRKWDPVVKKESKKIRVRHLEFFWRVLGCYETIEGFTVKLLMEIERIIRY